MGVPAGTAIVIVAGLVLGMGGSQGEADLTPSSAAVGGQSPNAAGLGRARTAPGVLGVEPGISPGVSPGVAVKVDGPTDCPRRPKRSTCRFSYSTSRPDPLPPAPSRWWWLAPRVVSMPGPPWVVVECQGGTCRLSRLPVGDTLRGRIP